MVKQWIVGFEPDGEHDGPVHFAAWLQQHSRPPQKVAGVHVLPSEALIGEEGSERAQSEARQACARTLVRTESTELFDGVELVDADGIDEGLLRAVAELEADACIIGRRARRQEIRLQRLGPVARHLLRRLPTSLVIVPPDWIPQHVGPVLLATDLSDSSVGAAGFARALATSLTCPVIAVHVSRHGDWAGPHFEGAIFQATRQRIREDAAGDLDAWTAAHGLADCTKTVILGDPVSAVAGLANEERASMIVCGSRQLGTAARLFGHSVASELAAVAEIPVAVVPG